jgi:MYXO-CTERM domain-containing protein
MRSRLALALVSGSLLVASGTAHADLPSGPLVRSNKNPIVDVGAPGEIDDYKTGSRVILEQGQAFRMWYGAVPDPNKGKTRYATSSDAVSWQKQGLHVEPLTPWEGGSDGEAVPGGLLVRDGLYWLYYHAFDPNEGARRIGRAVSDTDGLTWKKETLPVLEVGQQGAWDDRQVAEPRVFRWKGQYWMFYAGTGAASPGMWRLGAATSADGLAWTKHPMNPLGGTAVPAHEAPGHGLIYDGGAWHLWWGQGLGASTTIRYASSTDGLAWTDGGANPVLAGSGTATAPDVQVGDSISVYRSGAEYRVLYTGTNPVYANAQGRISAICMATIAVPPNGPKPKVTVKALGPLQELPSKQTAFTVTRTDTLAVPTRVTFKVSGTATSGVDYAALQPPEVVIPVGSDEATVTLEVRADNLVEGDETVTLQLEAGADYELGAEASATATITDAPPRPMDAGFPGDDAGTGSTSSGGCGCAVPPQGASSAAAGLVAALGLLLARARRRR